MVLLYNIGLYILLLYLVIDIIILVYFLFSTFFAIVGLLFLNNIVFLSKLFF